MLLGADGKPIASDALKAAKKACVEAWLEEALAGDRDMGRSSANFAIPPEQEIRPYMPSFKEKSIAVYVGSGNLVLVDLKPAEPLVVQRRPLAQRQVQLVIE